MLILLVFLKDLIDENAILVVNKSDLLKGNISKELKKHDYVLVSIKNNLNLDKLILNIKKKIRK